MDRINNGKKEEKKSEHGRSRDGLCYSANVGGNHHYRKKK